MKLDVAKLNAMPAAEALAQLQHCCGASKWAQAMLSARPFRDSAAVQKRAEECFASLTDADWREAFTHHPKIGDLDSLRKKFQSSAHLAATEQAGVSSANEATIRALAAGNSDYEKRFGYIFIVCATGKSAAEMLQILQERLPHDPAAELAVAAAEQRKITWLRLEKCFA